jgi:hypothetical protein
VGERIRIQVATSYLRQRADAARAADEWADVAMFQSLAGELDELRALAAEVVDVPHFIEFDDDGWSIEHPYACRAGGARLLDCEVHQKATKTGNPPRCAPGRYRLDISPEDGGLAIDLDSHEEADRG